MGREQGDHLGDEQPVRYVGKVNGVEYVRDAVTPADHVNLRARGWVTEKSLGRDTRTGTTTSETGSRPAPSSSTTDQQSNEAEGPARRGGRRAPDVASAAPQDEAAAAAGGTG